MEKNLDERMDEIAARIEETQRIRRGLYAHLGERVFNQVVADPDLRNGKEEILGAIAACNRELGRLEDALASLDARLFAARQVSESAGQMAPEPAPATEIEVEVEDAPVEQAVLEAPADDTVAAEDTAAGADVAAEYDATGFPVTVAPIEPLAPAAAPDPVVLEPVTFEVDKAAEAIADEAANMAAEPVAAEPAPVVADAVDAGAPTIVLDRGGEAEAAPVAEAAPAAATTPAVRTCPVCGCEVAPDHRFCMNCGYRLAD